MNPDAFKLSLTQEFELQRIINASIHIKPDEAADLLVQQSRLLMVKDNVIRDLMRTAIASSSFSDVSGSQSCNLDCLIGLLCAAHQYAVEYCEQNSPNAIGDAGAYIQSAIRVLREIQGGDRD